MSEESLRRGDRGGTDPPGVTMAMAFMGGDWMHATFANLETCAWMECCQPADTVVTHGSVKEPVAIAYCRLHAIKVLGYDPDQRTDADESRATT